MISVRRRHAKPLPTRTRSSIQDGPIAGSANADIVRVTAFDPVSGATAQYAHESPPMGGSDGLSGAGHAPVHKGDKLDLDDSEAPSFDATPADGDRTLVPASNDASSAGRTTERPAFEIVPVSEPTAPGLATQEPVCGRGPISAAVPGVARPRR